MKQAKRLQWTLNILGVYLTILGVLFLFLPSVAETAFSISLPDPALTPLYGQLVLVIALMAFLVARDTEKHATLVWALIFEQAGHVLVFLYLLVTSRNTFAQMGPPLIVAVIFLVLLLVFRR